MILFLLLLSSLSHLTLFLFFYGVGLSFPANETPTADSMALSLPERFRGAMWGMYIGDALAMPVHWYYDTNQLRRDFGQITKYEGKCELPRSFRMPP